MSITNSKFTQAIRRATCPRCSAAPLRPCVRKDGLIASTCHNERLRAAGFGNQALRSHDA